MDIEQRKLFKIISKIILKKQVRFILMVTLGIISFYIIKSYCRVKEWGYLHDVSNHSIGQYAKTNRIENLWYRMKLMNKRIQNQFKLKNLNINISELEWRLKICKIIFLFND